MTVQTAAVALGEFDDPPIVEVVCGVKFAPLQGLDPIVLGSYWKERSSDYPNREVHEALLEPGQLILFGAQPIRYWFVAAGGDFLLQLQHDRFFVNWRKVRDGIYPRFNDRAGQPGVLSIALREFEMFSKFCADALGARPTPVRCELSKIDQLTEHRHWHGTQDLAELLPWLQSFVGFSTSGVPEFAMQFSEPRDGGNLSVSLRSALTMERARSVVVETQINRQLSPNTLLQDEFRAANFEANNVFGHLVPASQHHRFSRKGALLR